MWNAISLVQDLNLCRFCPFPATIIITPRAPPKTITPRAPPSKNNVIRTNYIWQKRDVILYTIISTSVFLKLLHLRNTQYGRFHFLFLFLIQSLCYLFDVRPCASSLSLIFSFRVFHTNVSWWSLTGVWLTASLFKSPGLFSVFWPILVML